MSAIKQEMADETPSLSALPAAQSLPDRSVLGLRRMRLCDHAERVIGRRSSSREEFESPLRIGSVNREGRLTVNKPRTPHGDELAVLVSLTLAFGMLVGALAAVWMWTIVADRRAAVVSVSAPEIP